MNKKTKLLKVKEKVYQYDWGAISTLWLIFFFVWGIAYLTKMYLMAYILSGSLLMLIIAMRDDVLKDSYEIEREFEVVSK